MTTPQQPAQPSEQHASQQPPSGAGFAGAAPLPPPGVGFPPPYPPPGYAPPYSPPYPPPGYGPPPPGYAYGPPPNNNENVLAGISHLSIFFGALIVPLIIWLTTRGSSPYASKQAKQAFFFHVGYTVIEVILSLVAYGFFFAFVFSTAATTSPDSGAAPPVFVGVGFIVFLILSLVISAVAIAAIVFGVYGAVQAFNGRPFHYPFLARI